MINLLKYIDQQRFAPYVICYGTGPAVNEFNRLAPTVTFQPWTFKSAGIVARNVQRLERRARKRWLMQHLHTISPDVIYYNTVANNDYVLWSAPWRRPKIMHFHEYGSLASLITSPNWLALLPTFVNHFVAVSDVVRQFIINWTGVEATRVYTIHESLDIAELDSYRTRPTAELRAELGLPSQDTIIGHVGAPAYAKGTDLLLESFALLRQRRADSGLRLVWVGGSDRQHPSMKPMREMAGRLGIAEAVTFVEPTTDVLSYYKLFDVFAMPSREDSFPLVVLEAMLMNTPVVALPLGGASEALADGAGLVVDGITPQHLANGIAQVLDDGPLRDQFRQVGSRRVREKYDARSNVELVHALLQNASAEATATV